MSEGGRVVESWKKGEDTSAARLGARNSVTKEEQRQRELFLSEAKVAVKLILDHRL